MRIVGIDPGYATVGFGVADYARGKFEVVDYGAILTDADSDFEKRLVEIHADLSELIGLYKPDFLATERLYFTTNQKTAIAVAEARGVILLTFAERGIPVAEYTPLQIKQAVTGYGKAVKKQVQEMTAKILKLDAVPKPDDTADALAALICHAHCYNSRMKTKR